MGAPSTRCLSAAGVVCRWALAASVLVLWADSGCRQRNQNGAGAEPKPALGEVSVDNYTSSEQAGVIADSHLLAARARSRLLGAGIFSGPAGHDARAPSVRVRIAVSGERVAAGGKLAARALVRLVVEGRPAELVPTHFREDVQAGAEDVVKDSAGEKEPLQSLLERTIDDLLASYTARQRLWSASPNQLRAAATADAGEIRMEAARAIAGRRLVDQVPVLIGLLSDDDETVRDAALGALVQLRDPRAVTALTKSRAMADRRELRKIIDALASIGGREATDYLSFVADAHDDEEIRAMARSALERMKRPAPK